MDAADKDDDEVDLFDDELMLLWNGPHCCLLAVLDLTDAKASVGEMRREKHVATAIATLMILFLLK